MSRLQSGCLALVVGFDYEDDLLGEVVSLVEYKPVGSYDTPEGVVLSIDDWIIKTRANEEFCVSARNLLLLGDKQTQDELVKEREIENS